MRNERTEQIINAKLWQSIRVFCSHTWLVLGIVRVNYTRTHIMYVRVKEKDN